MSTRQFLALLLAIASIVPGVISIAMFASPSDIQWSLPLAGWFLAGLALFCTPRHKATTAVALVGIAVCLMPWILLAIVIFSGGAAVSH